MSDPLSLGSTVSTSGGSAATRWFRRAIGRFRGAGLPHSVLDAGPDAVVVLDEDGQILTANRAACEALGHAPGALVGADFAETALARRSRAAFASRLRSPAEAASAAGATVIST